MDRKYWGLIIPVLLTGMLFIALAKSALSETVRNGILLGTLIALIQSLLSGVAMSWALNRDSFYWIWGGGFFLRILTFALTGFIILKFTSLSFAATLISMALATMVFLVTESSFMIRTR